MDLRFCILDNSRKSEPTTKRENAVRIRQILTMLRPELVAYAQSLTLVAHESEDLVHDAVVRALKTNSAPEQIADLRPWMFRIIKNLFIDGKRKERVHREFSIAQIRLPDIGSAQNGDPAEALMVRQAYTGLNLRNREILYLVDIMGLTYTQAASVIEVPIGTVMSRVSRARRAMRKRMGETNVSPIKTHKG